MKVVNARGMKIFKSELFKLSYKGFEFESSWEIAIQSKRNYSSKFKIIAVAIGRPRALSS